MVIINYNYILNIITTKRQKMNVLLEKLLLHESLTEKDRYEIRQIFDFVSIEKKQNILNNFDTMVASIMKIKKDLYTEQEILLGKAISNIERTLKIVRTSGIKNGTSSSIWVLKQHM